MKKIIFILMIIFSSLGFSALKDGIYSAEKSYGGSWKSFARITVKGERIIGAQFDRKGNSGEMQSLSKAELRDAFIEMARSLTSSQNADGVSGKDAKAVSEFRELVKFLLKKAENGETGNFEM
jgi:pheromone cAD1 o protein